MKLFSSILSLILLSGAALADRVPVTDIRGLFVPVGYDHNDEVTVVVDGYLPDPCHRLRQPEVKIQGKAVSVTPMSETVTGICTDMIVPFSQEVRVGTLKPGTYEVRAGNGESQSLLIQVARRPSRDDFFYAAVEGVYVNPDKRAMRLRGRFTASCQSLDEVRVIHTGRTIQVLPILKVAEGPCEKKEREFEKEVALPQLTPGRYLLHVRSLNGQAVNEVFAIAKP